MDLKEQLLHILFSQFKQEIFDFKIGIVGSFMYQTLGVPLTKKKDIDLIIIEGEEGDDIMNRIELFTHQMKIFQSVKRKVWINKDNVPQNTAHIFTSMGLVELFRKSKDTYDNRLYPIIPGVVMGTTKFSLQVDYYTYLINKAIEYNKTYLVPKFTKVLNRYKELCETETT